jgi:hypothetical protein
MIEINDIIELRTNNDTERLAFAVRYLVQINFTFDLIAWSGDFRGASHFCVRREQIEEMCANLKNMHVKLSGMTKLEDEDSDSFIEFEMKPNGHLNVRGQVGGTHEDHFMTFKFKTDQTCIPTFVQDFNTLLNINDAP